MNWVELISVAAAILYVILAARNNVWCWSFGILSAILWAYAAFAFYDLYVDALLQIYYIGMGAYGWYMWRENSTAHPDETLPITTLPIQQHIFIIISGVALTIGVGYFFATFTPAAATYLDAFTTVFSVITTVMVARRKLENWLYWIVIDATYIYLYGSRGGYLFAFLNIVYVIIAAWGYWNWRKSYRAVTENALNV